MNIQRLLNSKIGQIVLSIILGLGLATMFRKVCNDRNCIVFHGPIISENDIYKHNDKCQKYTTQSMKCDSTKRIIDIEERKDVHKPKIFGIL